MHAYVLKYISIRVFIIYTNTNIYIYINRMCEHTCMLEVAFGCMCVCKHIDVYVSMRSCVHIDIHIRMSICI